MAGGGEFRFQALQEREAVAGYLRALADGLAAGEVTLAREGRELGLTPGGLVRLTLQARRGERRSRLVVKLAWREGTGEGEGPRTLTITPGGA